MNDKTNFPEYAAIENLRKKLARDNTLFTVEDLGAGSATDKTDQRTVSSITKNAVKQKKFAQLLFRMTRYYQPKTILELGTSLGITTSYLASANPGAEVISLEGAKAVAEVARNNFKILGLNNIRLAEGNFNDTLSIILSQLSSADLVFIDGNHRKEPTIQYFNSIINKINNFSIVVLDDIHWSRDMEEAWEYCKQHETVSLGLDLFFLGILFFRKEVKEKQQFSIRF